MILAFPECGFSSLALVVMQRIATCLTTIIVTWWYTPVHTITTPRSVGSTVLPAKGQHATPNRLKRTPILPGVSQYRRARDQLGLHSHRSRVGRKYSDCASSGLARTWQRGAHESSEYYLRELVLALPQERAHGSACEAAEKSDGVIRKRVVS